jgi:ABC-type sugar transport system substrate-binding protein
MSDHEWRARRRARRAISSRAARWAVVGVMSSAVALGLAACGGASSSSTSSGGTTASTGGAAASKVKGTFYEINNGCPSDPFWASVNNGAQAGARDLGVDLKIEVPRNCESQADENALLTAAVNSQPAGIAISVTSATAFSAQIKRARSMGIPVIAYNSVPPNNDPNQNPIQAFVGTDLFQGGVAFATYGFPKFNIGNGDTVLLADNCPTNISCNTIFNGFKSKARAAGVSTPVVNVSYAVARNIPIVHSYLSLHPNVKMVVTLGETGADAAIAALKSLHYKPGQVPVAGFNLGGLEPAYMKQGWYAFSVDQLPYLQGFDALVDLYTAAKYHQPPVNITTGPEVVTPSDPSLLTPSMVNNTGY